MVSVHNLVGTAALLLFILNTVMYAMTMSRGTGFAQHRLVSISAATALLLQYALGFMLLADSHSISIWHIVAAIASFLPVGMEHMATARETDARRRGRLGFIASLMTTALILTAYMIAEMR